MTRLASDQHKLVLVISILASFVAFLDGSVVNVGLPAIVRELGGGLVTQQWVVDAYLITLSSLILVAGSLSDLLGRKQILSLGLLGFGVTSVLCAVAPTSGSLIAFRALQGVAGALLVPSSLALIIAVFGSNGAGKAIGTWTAWTGIAYIVGPLVGGFLIGAASWRWIFAINVLPIAVTIGLMRRLRHEEEKQGAKVDAVGAVLCALGLCGSVFALIEQSHYGWGSPIIYIPLVVGVAMLIFFVRHEQHIEQPMLTMELFKVRNFSVGNVATVAIYGGLSVASFLITVFIQQVGGYSAIKAGLALLPVTIIMFVLSPRFGALCTKYGPRFFMSTGPAVAGVGFLLLLRVDQSVQYWPQLLPSVLLFGLGLSMTVAPLTTAILGSIESKHAGIGSAINNAVARVAGLVAIAAIGIVTGPMLETAGFHRGAIAMAMLLFVGAAISAVGIQSSPMVRVHRKAGVSVELQS